MPKWLAQLLYCVSLLSIFFCSASIATPASELLEKAYSQRTLGIHQFRETLNQVEKNYRLSTQELDFFRFLTGYAFYLEGEVEQAIDLFKQSKSSDSIRIQILSSCLLTLSFSNVKAGSAKAFEYLFRALELKDKTSDPEMVASIYTIAASMYQRIYQDNQTRYYAEEGLKVAPSARWQCMFGGFLVQLNSEDEQIFNRTINHCSEAKEPMLALNARLWYVEKLTKDKPQWVYHFLLPHLAESEKQGFTLQQIGVKALLGKAALLQNHLVEAENYLLQANAQLSSLNDFKTQNLIFTSLALLYQKQNKPEKSAEFYRLAYENAQRQRKIDMENALAYQVAKLNALQEQQESERLENQLKLSLAEAKTQKLNAAIAVMVTILVIISGGTMSWFLYHRSTRFKQLSIIDSLTGTYNRRHFDHQLISLLNKKNNAIHSLIIFDLDWFKQINDNYGHAAGDKVLIEVCKLARRQGRRVDLLARIGGEEFAIILKECPLIQAGLIAEQIREATEKLDFEKLYPGLKVTASFGVCSCDLADGQFDRWLQLTDQALYQSKKRGRNLVTLYEPEQRGK